MDGESQTDLQAAEQDHKAAYAVWQSSVKHWGKEHPNTKPLYDMAVAAKKAVEMLQPVGKRRSKLDEKWHKVKEELQHQLDDRDAQNKKLRAAHETFDALEKHIGWTRKSLEDIEADINELEEELEDEEDSTAPEEQLTHVFHR